MAIDHDLSEGKCPFTGVRRHNAGSGPTNADWWPNQLTSRFYVRTPPIRSMGKEFSYAEEFKNLDLNAVIKDLHALMTDSRLVAGRFRPLRRTFHSNGVARRGYVPHRRGPRWRRSWPAAFRTAR